MLIKHRKVDFERAFYAGFFPPSYSSEPDVEWFKKKKN